MNIFNIRQALHKIAELSAHEIKTKEYIKSILETLHPDRIIEFDDSNSLMAVYNEKAKKKILFRADIDAVAVNEKNLFEYRSQNKNISHKCGHDGHSACLLLFASKLEELSIIENICVVLLFQAEEETGSGAKKIINKEEFLDFKFDYVFAMHNIPAYELNSIIIKDDLFSLASKGLFLKFEGKSSHAAEYEKGINPSKALAEFIEGLDYIKRLMSKKISLCITHIKMGEESFGISPGDLEIRVTLRSNTSISIEKSVALIQDLSNQIAVKNNLKEKISLHEEFFEVKNDSDAIKILEETASNLNMKINKLDKPFSWSEDFGLILDDYRGALFGIGAGMEHPDLHNEYYDFPDEIIENAVEYYVNLVKTIANQ